MDAAIVADAAADATVEVPADGAPADGWVDAWVRSDAAVDDAGVADAAMADAASADAAMADAAMADAAMADASTPRCGDGVVQDGEECDDGNDVDTDGCTSACELAVCGDGLVQPGESCDGAGETALCDADCTEAVCGDGYTNVSAGEECDDGNDVDTDGCTSACELAVCGDGFVQPGESCDGAGETALCDADCTEAVCGDGYTNVSAGEECDDGNDVATDGCDGCVLVAPPSCGNGIVEAGEECDDGNTVNTDSCTNACAHARCGDGYTQPGEGCDDGNTVNTDSCTNACQPAACGDGFTQPGEDCDDGNTVDHDRCSNACTRNVATLDVENPDRPASGTSSVDWMYQTFVAGRTGYLHTIRVVFRDYGMGCGRIHFELFEGAGGGGALLGTATGPRFGCDGTLDFVDDAVMVTAGQTYTLAFRRPTITATGILGITTTADFYPDGCLTSDITGACAPNTTDLVFSTYVYTP